MDTRRPHRRHADAPLVALLRGSAICITTFAIATVAMAQAPAPPEQIPPLPMSEAAFVQQLAHSSDSLAAIGELSGVVTLARHGTIVFQRAYGEANRDTHRPNTASTEFNLGSINKIFTFIAMHQLEDAGKVNLDSTLGKYWPDYPNVAVRAVTLRQLLRHTSGIGGDVFGPPPGKTVRDIDKLSDYLPIFVNAPLKFAPGTSNAYANPGYVVLGLLIERISGQSYYDYVRDHVYAPAGMTHTAHYRSDALPADAAIGYTRPEGGTALVANTSLLPGRGSSAGGGYSTAADLVRFAQALREHRIRSAPNPGLGIAGGSEGVNGVLETAMPGDYDLVVLTNLDPPAAMRLAGLVHGWLGMNVNAGPGVVRKP